MPASVSALVISDSRTGRPGRSRARRSSTRSHARRRAGHGAEHEDDHRRAEQRARGLGRELAHQARHQNRRSPSSREDDLLARRARQPDASVTRGEHRGRRRGSTSWAAGSLGCVEQRSISARLHARARAARAVAALASAAGEQHAATDTSGNQQRELSRCCRYFATFGLGQRSPRPGTGTTLTSATSTRAADDRHPAERLHRRVHQAPRPRRIGVPSHRRAARPRPSSRRPRRPAARSRPARAAPKARTRPRPASPRSHRGAIGRSGRS
jgi:hypothetical protein